MVRLPDGARIETGPGGLERLVVAAAGAEAHVYLHGSHVAHFQPAGERPVLWMSGQSRFESGKPIRGGVPICFPWFGPKAGAADAPLHGLVRSRPWGLHAVTPDDGRLRATLELSSDESTLGHFPHELRVSLDVTVGAALSLALTVRNTGPSRFAFEEALHSYFAVSDVRQVLLRGLEGVAFVDKTAGGVRRAGESAPIAITGETDRVYLGTGSTVTIEDPGWGRRIAVAKTGSRTTVVWNPWVARAKAMPDFGDDEWTGMVCVETANALEDAVSLAPGESHTTTVAIEVWR
jgi:D-hexose-6-phosphate mutarotase